MTDMTVPLGPGDDDITAFQRNMEQRRQQRLRDTIMSATRQDPRRALESYKYGLSLTAPQEMVEQTKQQFQGLSLYQRIKNNPTTASMFMDSQFAAVAAPDAESIGFWESLYRVPTSAILDVAAGGMRAMEESITQMRIDMDQVAIEKTTQFLSQPDLTDEQRQIAEANLFSAQERINSLRQNLDPTYFSQLRSTLEQFSDEIRISPTSGLGQVLASAGHSTSIAVPFLFLGPLGMIAAFAASEYGAASRDAELRGADLETRRGRGARSSFYGAALGALPVVNMFGRAAAGVGLRANILRTIGQEIPTEVATEVIDTVDRILTFEPDRLFTEETLRELGETTVITALSTVLSVGATTTALHKIGAAANRQQENIDSANASADALRQAGDTIASTQVLGSTANLLSSVANRIAEDTNTQGRRIDVDTFVSLIDQLGGEQAVRSTLPNVMSQVDELGTGVGQEIVLTAGEYATQIQNNPRLRSILEPHVRVGYDELSATEAQEAEQSVAEFAEALNQKLEADAEKAAAKNADRDALRDRIIDSVLSQPPFRQAVQAEQAGPEVLEAPRVTPEYSGPEPTLPAEMLSEGQGQDVGEIKFSRWDELAEFLDERDEVGTLNALQAFAGRLSPRTEAGQRIALDIAGGATGNQYQKLTAKLTTLASDLERVTDSVSDALYNSVVRFDEVSESVRQSGANALVAIVDERIASNGKISDSTKSEVNAAKESLLTSSKETKEYKAAANLLIDFVVERLDYRSSLLAAKQLDETFALIDSDRKSPLEAIKEAMASFFGYEYLGSDTMISERGAWEQAMVRQSFEDAGLEAPRVTPSIDAAYMAAVEADAITRDADGNIIPLSQRFDVTRPSILYAPDTGGGQLKAEQVKASAEIAAEMFSNLAENILGVSPQTMWDTYGANIIQDLETMTPEQRQAAESAAGAYYPKSMSVILGQKQTADTLIHELTHHYLHILSTVALQPSTSPNADANEAVVKARRFFEDILVALDDTGEMAAKGFGAVEHWQSLSADAKRDIHETFAYGFQKYLGTAKAPTNKLRDAYAKVRRWMTELYGRGLKKLGIIFEQRYKRQLPALTPEVIAIFDRMVGSEIAIAKANEVDNAVPLFLSKEESGMTDEQWGRLQEATRRRDDEAIVQMMARFHRDMRWTTRSISRFVAKTQREVSKQRGRIRNEVRAEVEERPVYRALRFFRTGMVRNQQGELVKVEGSHRLDIETVKERYSALDWKSLGFGRNGALGKNGLDPDVIAVDLDFESGDELIRAMLDAAPINDVITSLTEQRLLAEHGEMMDPMAVEAAAIESVRNKHQATLSSLEQSFLEGGTRPAQALRRAAQIAAQQRLGKMALGEIKPHQFALAAKRASKVAQQAFRDGRQQDALKAKREQLAMEMAHLEAKKIQKRVEKQIKQLRKLRSNAKNESVGADYADRINTVLSKLSVEKGVALHVPRPQVVRATLEQHVAAMEADQQGSELTATTDRIPPKTEDEPYTVLDEINSMGVTYVYDMPLEQFDDIMRVVDELVHIGRQVTKGRLLTIKADADAVLKELAETAGKYNSRLRVSEQAQTKLESFVAGAKGIASSHITAQSKFIIMDGGEYGGVHFKTFVAPTSEIGDAETAAIMETTQKVQAILKPLYDQKGFNVRVFRPEVGLSKSPKQIVFAAANMLNETNEQRLVSGEEWGVPMPADADDDVQDQVYAARRENIINMIQNHLTADQVRMAQQMSDLFADFKPEIAKLYRDTSGTEPRWVEPRPITFRMVSGEEVTLRGGYYPIEYDRYGSTTGLKRIMAKLADSLRRTGPTAATTSNAYTKSRVSRVVNAPLLLDDTVLTSALEEVIHDLHWRRWSIDMNRLMRPGTVWYETMRANYGADFVSELINWRNRTASGGVVESNQAAKKLLSYAGKYASQASLLFNPGSVLIQPIGMLAIDPATGTKHANYGRTRVMTDFKAAYSEMMSRTPQMKLRYITRHRELREINLRIRGKSTNTAAIEAAGYQLMQSAQSIADVAAWHAGFNMAIEQGKTHEEAGKIAYQVVLDTQSSGRVQDLSEVETGLIGYLFNSFYRPLNAQFNLVARKAVLTDQEKRAAKKGLVKDLAMLFVLMPYVIMLMKRAVRPPEKEDEEFWTVENQMTLLTSETLKALASNFIGIREMQEFFPALLGEQAYRYTGPTKLRLANDIINLGSQIGQGIRGVGEGDPSKLYDKGMIRSISNVLGDLFGFPSAAINGLVEGITAAIEGRVYPFDEDGDLPPWAIITGTSK